VVRHAREERQAIELSPQLREMVQIEWPRC